MPPTGEYDDSKEDQRRAAADQQSTLGEKKYKDLSNVWSFEDDDEDKSLEHIEEQKLAEGAAAFGEKEAPVQQPVNRKNKPSTVAPLPKKTDQEGGIVASTAGTILNGVGAANAPHADNEFASGGNVDSDKDSEGIAEFFQLYGGLSKLVDMAFKDKSKSQGWEPVLNTVSEGLNIAHAVAKINNNDNAKFIVGAIREAWNTFQTFYDIINDYQKLMKKKDAGENKNDVNLHKEIVAHLLKATESSASLARNFNECLANPGLKHLPLVGPITSILNNGLDLATIIFKCEGHNELVVDLQKEKDAKKVEWYKSFEGKPLDIDSSVDINRKTSAIKANTTLDVKNNQMLDEKQAQGKIEEKIRTKMEEADISQDNNSLDETQKQLLKDYTAFDEIIKAKDKAHRKDMVKVVLHSAKILASTLKIVPEAATFLTGSGIETAVAGSVVAMDIGNDIRQMARENGTMGADKSKSTPAKKAWRVEQATNIYNNTTNLRKDHGSMLTYYNNHKANIPAKIPANATNDYKSTNIMLRGVGINNKKSEELAKSGASNFKNEIYKGLTKREM